MSDSTALPSPPADAANIHASCVARRTAQGWRGILLLGESGAGKSDLALRLIDRGAVLVADDRCLLWSAEQALWCAAPPTLQAKIEMRGVGIHTLEQWRAAVPLALAVTLADAHERVPQPDESIEIAGYRLPALGLPAFAASTVIKIEMVLAQHSNLA